MPSFQECELTEADKARYETTWSIVCYRQQGEENSHAKIVDLSKLFASKIFGTIFRERWDVRVFPASPGLRLQAIDAIIRNSSRTLILTFQGLSREKAQLLGMSLPGTYRVRSLQDIRLQLEYHANV